MLMTAGIVVDGMEIKLMIRKSHNELLSYEAKS